MQTYPIKLTAHVRSYYFGERLIPEMLGKKEVPEGVVAETWEISDYREARATMTNGPYAGRTPVCGAYAAWGAVPVPPFLDQRHDLRF